MAAAPFPNVSRLSPLLAIVELTILSVDGPLGPDREFEKLRMFAIGPPLPLIVLFVIVVVPASCITPAWSVAELLLSVLPEIVRMPVEAMAPPMPPTLFEMVQAVMVRFA